MRLWGWAKTTQSCGICFQSCWIVFAHPQSLVSIFSIIFCIRKLSYTLNFSCHTSRRLRWPCCFSFLLQVKKGTGRIGLGKAKIHLTLKMWDRSVLGADSPPKNSSFFPVYSTFRQVTHHIFFKFEHWKRWMTSVEPLKVPSFEKGSSVHYAKTENET